MRKIFFKSVVAILMVLQLNIDSYSSFSVYGKDLNIEKDIYINSTYFNPSLSDDEKLKKIFTTKFKTKENGQFSQGYSFSIKLDFCDEPILITPHSIIENAYLSWSLRKSDRLEWNEVSNYLSGGYVFDKITSEDTNAYISQIINIDGANSIMPDKNISAFKLKNTDNLMPYEISNLPIQKDESIYLVANLMEKDDYSYEDIILKGNCLENSGGLIYFTLENIDIEKSKIDYIIGAPILDREGKIVAMLNSYDKDNKNILIGIKSNQFATLLSSSLN